MAGSRDLETKRDQEGFWEEGAPCLGEEDAKHILLKCSETKKSGGKNV
jgi:hypothetical protein